MLTATQEDYLEAIHRIRADAGDVHVTILAERLGCKLPTVTRTIQKMAERGFVRHEARGKVELTELGKATAEHLVHRHEDAVTFLYEILGLTAAESESDACQLEHGLSPLAAQRLHRWLQHIADLNPEIRERVLRFRGRDAQAVPDFDWLPDTRHHGWRG